jgi:hypothetical protein
MWPCGHLSILKVVYVRVLDHLYISRPSALMWPHGQMATFPSLAIFPHLAI